MSAGASRPGFLASVAAVLRHDLRVLFLAPAGWVFLAGWLFLAGLISAAALAETGEASLRPALPGLAVTLLFLLPLVTLRQLAEEARSGTLELLLTLPVRTEAILLGKWLSAMALCGGMLALTAPLPAALAALGDPDPGALLTGYLGLYACCALFTAAGLFASALTRDTTAAGALAVLILLPSWLASLAREQAPAALRPALDRIAFLGHLDGAARGVIDTGELAWFAAATGAFLVLADLALGSRRWR